MNVKLKRCPCCGETAELKQVNPNYPLRLRRNYYYVTCTKCAMQTNLYIDKEAAIRLWDYYCTVAETEETMGQTNNYEEMWNGLRGYFKHIAESEQNIYVVAVFLGLYQLMREVEEKGLPALDEVTIKLEDYK